MEEKYITGNFIFELRKEKKISQAQLGLMLGVTNKAVSKWENGDNKPEVKMLYKIANVLGVSVDELLHGKRDEVLSEKQLAKENKMLAERLKRVEKEKQESSIKYFESVFYLLTVVMVFFLFVFISFLFDADFNLNTLSNFLISLLIFSCIAVVLASFVSGAYLLENFIKNVDSIFIIILLCLFPFTIMAMFVLGFIFLIPSLVKSYKIGFPNGIKKSLTEEKKRLLIEFLVSLFIGFISCLVMLLLKINNKSLNYIYTVLVDLLLFVEISLITIICQIRLKNINKLEIN